MERLHITGVDYDSSDKLLLELSDGRTLIFSLQKLLSLEPDAIFSYEGEEEEVRA